MKLTLFHCCVKSLIEAHHVAHDVLITERVLSAAYRARAVLPQPVDDAVPAEEMRARQLRRGVAHDLRLETFFPECSFPPIWI